MLLLVCVSKQRLRCCRTNSSPVATLTVLTLVTEFAGEKWLYHRPYPDNHTH